MNLALDCQGLSPNCLLVLWGGRDEAGQGLWAGFPKEEVRARLRLDGQAGVGLMERTCVWRGGGGLGRAYWVGPSGAGRWEQGLSEEPAAISACHLGYPVLVKSK